MFLIGCLSAVVFARLYQPIRGICRVSDHERIFVRMWNDIRKSHKLKKWNAQRSRLTTYRKCFTCSSFRENLVKRFPSDPQREWMAMEAKPKEKRFVESSFVTMVTMRARCLMVVSLDSDRKSGIESWDHVIVLHSYTQEHEWLPTNCNRKPEWILWLTYNDDKV